MSVDREDNPLALDQPDEVRRLREALDQAGYAPKQLGELLRVRPEELASFRAAGKNAAIMALRAAGDSPLAVFTRLFLLGLSVDLPTARRAFAPSDPEKWVAAGLLEPRGDGVGATIQLTAYEHLILATDALWRPEPHPKHVLAVGSPTFLLSQMTVRRRSRRTLDVGAGSGVQAFLAAPHSDEVVGVDLNPRAVNCANFNAQLNGLPRVRFLQGDLYAPVREQRFDLIVANPPYVISPEARFIFRDSGLKGDEIAQRVIREGTPLLEEGGYLQMICEWAHVKGRAWEGRLASWFSGTGCDAWVVRYSHVDSLKHAEVWLKSGVSEAPESLAARVQAWLDYHQREGIEAISDGVITLRKRSGASNWVRFDETPPRTGDCGGSVERGFAAATFLQQTIDNEALLASRLRVAPDVTWERRMARTDAGWTVKEQQMFVSSGLGFRGDADDACVALMDRCRGDRSVREVLGDLARLSGQTLDQGMILRVIRGLVEQGHLLPVQ